MYPMWQGRAASTVYREEGNVNHRQLLIQYWEPRNVARLMRKKYENCWDAHWIKENRETEWISVDCVLFAI